MWWTDWRNLKIKNGWANEETLRIHKRLWKKTLNVISDWNGGSIIVAVTSVASNWLMVPLEQKELKSYNTSCTLRPAPTLGINLPIEKILKCFLFYLLHNTPEHWGLLCHIFWNEIPFQMVYLCAEVCGCGLWAVDSGWDMRCRQRTKWRQFGWQQCDDIATPSKW